MYMIYNDHKMGPEHLWKLEPVVMKLHKSTYSNFFLDQNNVYCNLSHKRQAIETNRTPVTAYNWCAIQKGGTYRLDQLKCW